MNSEARHMPIKGYNVKDETKLLLLNGYVVRPLREWMRIAAFFEEPEALQNVNSWLDLASLDDLCLMRKPYELLPLTRDLLGFYPELFGIALPTSARELIALRSFPSRAYPDYFGLTGTPGFLKKYHCAGTPEGENLQTRLFN